VGRQNDGLSWQDSSCNLRHIVQQLRQQEINQSIVRKKPSNYAKCAPTAQTSDLKTGVLRDQSLWRMTIPTKIRSWLGKPLSKSKFADRAIYVRSGLHEITQVSFKIVRRLLAILRSANAATRAALAIGTAAENIRYRSNSLTCWALSHRARRTEVATDQTQRKAGHQKKSEVAARGFHVLFISHREERSYADQLNLYAP